MQRIKHTEFHALPFVTYFYLLINIISRIYSGEKGTLGLAKEKDEKTK